VIDFWEVTSAPIAWIGRANLVDVSPLDGNLLLDLSGAHDRHFGGLKQRIRTISGVEYEFACYCIRNIELRASWNQTLLSRQILNGGTERRQWIRVSLNFVARGNVTDVEIIGAPPLVNWIGVDACAVRPLSLPPILGDLNSDNVVDILDLSIMFDNYGLCFGCSSDLNYDSIVDVLVLGSC
jgi:hypothetical protein